MYGLVNNFFDNPNDKNYVKKRLASLINPIDISSSDISGTIPPVEREDCRAPDSMALRFNRGEIFTGRMNDEIAAFI